MVTTIIAVLIAILLPALATARSRSKQIVCASTLRNLMLATQLYAGDSNRLLPAPNTYNSGDRTYMWYNVLDAYLIGDETVVTLAGEQRHHEQKQDPIWFESEDPESNYTIKANANMDMCHDCISEISWRVSAIVPPPSLLVMYVDGRAWDITAPSNLHNSRYAATAGLVGLRHGGYKTDRDGIPGKSANIAFLDGHVQMHHDLVNLGGAYPSWFTNPNDPESASPDYSSRNELEWYPWYESHR